MPRLNRCKSAGNSSKNAEILKKCETLRQYSRFVEIVRSYGHIDQLTSAAMVQIMAQCQEENVLTEFMEHYGTELIEMLFKELTRVTPEQIERNIGISKDYNNFELRSAIVEKDILKANKIIKYFEENPKTNPIQMTLSLLFGFFSNLMLAYYAPEKTEQGIASFIGLKTPWQSREYLSAMRRYSGVKTMQIIGEIRYADAKSKGVGNSSLSDGDILRELVFKILH